MGENELKIVPLALSEKDNEAYLMAIKRGVLKQLYADGLLTRAQLTELLNKFK